MERRPLRPDEEAGECRGCGRMIVVSNGPPLKIYHESPPCDFFTRVCDQTGGRSDGVPVQISIPTDDDPTEVN
jgi:hypothetical protein